MAMEGSAAGGGRAECRACLSTLRYFSEVVLQVEATACGPRRRGVVRQAADAAPITARDLRDVIRKILYLRQQYHFGPGRIATYLHRFHQIPVARSSVHRILKRHGMSRLPANQKHRPYGKRWKRYEKLAPGHRLQVDVKFLERIPGTRRRLFQFTAIDDCTRIRVLKIFDALQPARGHPIHRRGACGVCHFACMSCRPTTAQNSNRSSIGTWRVEMSGIVTFGPAHPA